VDDIGGYFPARSAIGAMICFAPIGKELRIKLSQYALCRIDRDMRRLEELIPF
jgi:hypothetical protein